MKARDEQKQPPARPGTKGAATRNARGRFAAYVPSQADRNLAMLAAMAGFSQERAAALIGISETTLRAHLHDDWQRGADRASLKVVQNLYRMATATNADRTAVTAAIFWTKTRLGWRDRDPHPVEVETEAPADGVVRVRLRLFDSTPNAD